MIEELDVVALTAAVTAFDLAHDAEATLHAGDEGTVVMVHGNHEAYTVEFMEGGDSPYTRALVDVPAASVRLVWQCRRATDPQEGA